MPLQLQPMQESDFADLVRITTAAFQAGGGMTALLTADPLPADYVQKSIDKHIKTFHDEPDVHYVKVVDTELNGAMVAAAKWRINTSDRTQEQIQNMIPVSGPDEEGRPGVQDFYRFLARVRREYVGTKPSYLLHVLVTDPEHYRRGAGAMLIAWGTEQADEAQLPAYLESSSMARPLYTRMGFEAKHVEVFDLTKYGLEGTSENTVMIREPVPRVK